MADVEKVMTLFELINSNDPAKSIPKQRPATAAQKAFAIAISDLLDLDTPDFNSFRETSQFISEWKDEFYARRDELNLYDDDYY